MAHVYYNADPSLEVIKKDIEENARRTGIIFNHACFSSISTYYWKSPDNFYFGFQMPIGISERIVENYNAELQNIRIEIILKEEIRFAEDDWSNGLKTVRLQPEGTKYSDKEEPREFVLFHISLSDKYTPIAKYYLTASIAQFIREYGFEFKSAFKIPKNPEYTIEEALEISNNTGNVYGNWSLMYATDKEGFLLQDDPEVMNSIIVENTSVTIHMWYRPTELLTRTVTKSELPWVSSLIALINKHRGIPTILNEKSKTYKGQ